MSLKNCQNVKVLKIIQSSADIFALTIERPDWKVWKSGQFAMIRPVSWDLSLLWGRPISLSSGDEKSITLLIQQVGRGTRRLAELQVGDDVTIWGPLGNSFAVDAERPTLLLAGGIGIAPFHGYIQHHLAPKNISLFLAHRLPLETYEFDAISSRVDAHSIQENAPEDIGKIIEAIHEHVSKFAKKDGLILCCGPTPFMRTVQDAAAKAGTRAQVSLENRMACGVGACLGCVTKDENDHHVQTCTMGPIFWSDKVKL